MVQLPGWLLSLVLHAGLLLLAASRLSSCSDGTPGAPEGEWRTAGIVARAEASLSDATTESDAETDVSNTRELPATAVEEVPQAPPAELSLPQAPTVPTIGPGGTRLPAASSPVDLQNLALPNGLRPAGVAAGEEGHGKTSFFDVPAQGSRFVYLIDSSGSMESYGRLRAAKAELMRSLQSLDRTQQFQIIFYNNTPHTMMLRGTREPQLYWGTEINQTLARQFVSSIRADLGTKHIPALSRALSFEPDVLFFLTDADDGLDAGELNQIQRMNHGQAKIHTIEFGTAIAPEADSFLRKLSRQNGGSYRYVDVTKFR
ncbi:MAG: hypothetical protein KDA79_14720 [Planctomycetaceae bacterium]|nr:hypothetical protein [Planctomycetaceae bacterium]